MLGREGGSEGAPPSSRRTAGRGNIFARSVGRSVGRIHARLPHSARAGTMDIPHANASESTTQFLDLSPGHARRAGRAGTARTLAALSFRAAPCVVVSYFPLVRRWIIFCCVCASRARFCHASGRLMHNALTVPPAPWQSVEIFRAHNSPPPAVIPTRSRAYIL